MNLTPFKEKYMDGYCFITKTTGTGRPDDPAKAWAWKLGTSRTKIYYAPDGYAVVMGISNTEVRYTTEKDITAVTDITKVMVEGFNPEQFYAGEEPIIAGVKPPVLVVAVEK